MGINGRLRRRLRRLCVASGRKAAHRDRRRVQHRPARAAPWGVGTTRSVRCGSLSTRATPGPSRHRLHRPRLRMWEARQPLAALSRSGNRERRYPAAPLRVGTTHWTRCQQLWASTQSLRTGGRCRRTLLPGRGAALSVTTTLRHVIDACKTQTSVRMTLVQAEGQPTPMRG